MGTSTVSGPFRSQNGFQELVNGVWTPVGGGGGGGGAVVTINTADFPGTYQLPASAAVGDRITVQIVSPTNADAEGGFIISAEDGSLLKRFNSITPSFIFYGDNDDGSLPGFALMVNCTFVRINSTPYGMSSSINWMAVIDVINGSVTTPP
jgi:hypothetical protein